MKGRYTLVVEDIKVSEEQVGVVRVRLSSRLYWVMRSGRRVRSLDSSSYIPAP